MASRVTSSRCGDTNLVTNIPVRYVILEMKFSVTNICIFLFIIYITKAIENNYDFDIILYLLALIKTMSYSLDLVV